MKKLAVHFQCAPSVSLEIVHLSIAGWPAGEKPPSIRMWPGVSFGGKKAITFDEFEMTLHGVRVLKR